MFIEVTKSIRHFLHLVIEVGDTKIALTKIVELGVEVHHMSLP
jgi:hypothetical protein